MSRFFVGQRVRVRCSISCVDGKECRVIAVGVAAYDWVDGDYIGNEVDIPDPQEAGFLVFEDHELEPILPEGAQPGEFETLAELIDSLQVTA